MVSRLGADRDTDTPRTHKREQNITAGIHDLEQWLRDTLRLGLADRQIQTTAYWEAIAARMVDAQAPGLARQLRDCRTIPHSGEGWPSRLLAALGKLYLLTQGYQRYSTLSPGMQAELRQQVGWTIKKEDVLAGVADWTDAAAPFPLEQKDRWQVLGCRLQEEDRLWSRRVWLWGIESDRPGLMLDFAYGRPVFDLDWSPGNIVTAELVFYPSSYPLRALPRTVMDTVPGDGTLACDRPMAEAIALYHSALSHNPWLTRMPLILDAMVPTRSPSGLVLGDPDGQMAIAVSPGWAMEWELLALSGGHPMAIAGEWDGRYLRPLSAAVQSAAGQRLAVFD